MCGIVGVAGTGPMSLQMKEFFCSLLLHDVIRGHHATGVAAIDTLSRDLTVEKKAIPSPQFLEEKEAMDSLFATKHNFNIYIGHNRWATVGAKDDDDNAHPFIHGDIVGVHNGSLRQQSLLDDHTKFQVDSDNLYYHLNKHGLEDTVSKLNGAAALVWYDRSDNSLNFYRNDERPLALAKLSNGYWVWASEMGMLRWLVKRHKQLSFDSVTETTAEGAKIKFDQIFNLEKDQHMKITYKDHTRQYDGAPEYTEIKRPTFPEPERVYYGGNGYRGKNRWDNSDYSSRGNTENTYQKTVKDALDKFLTNGVVGSTVLEVEFQKIVKEKTSSGYEATLALFKFEAPNGKVVLCHAFVHNAVAFLKDWTEEEHKGTRVFGTVCTVSSLSSASYECTKNHELGFALSLNLVTQIKPARYVGFGKLETKGGVNEGKNVVPFRGERTLRAPHKETKAKAGSTSSEEVSAGQIEGVKDDDYMSRMISLANTSVPQRTLLRLLQENGPLCSNCGEKITTMPSQRLYRTTWFDRSEGVTQNYLSCSKSCFNLTEAVMCQLDEDYDKHFGGRDV